MVLVEGLQLDLPERFPAQSYAEFMARARSILLPDKGAPWEEFAGASNLVGWRFRASYEYLRAYLESWHQSGLNASFEELYARERDLFGMFSCGVSCIESTSYAAFALASHPGVLGVSFGEDEQRRAGPRTLRDAIADDPSAEGLVIALNSLLEASQWKTWVEFRNRMSHRSNLPRIIKGAVGGPAPAASPIQFAATSSTQALETDESNLSALFSWLAESLASLLEGCTALAAGHAPEQS